MTRAKRGNRLPPGSPSRASGGVLGGRSPAGRNPQATGRRVPAGVDATSRCSMRSPTTCCKRRSCAPRRPRRANNQEPGKTSESRQANRQRALRGKSPARAWEAPPRISCPGVQSRFVTNSFLCPTIVARYYTAITLPSPRKTPRRHGEHGGGEDIRLFGTSHLRSSLTAKPIAYPSSAGCPTTVSSYSDSS